MADRPTTSWPGARSAGVHYLRTRYAADVAYTQRQARRKPPVQAPQVFDQVRRFQAVVHRRPPRSQ